MGASHSLEDDLITFRLTRKQMEKSSLKCEKNQKIQMDKLKEAMKKGNMEGAKIYAENAIREKNQALNFLRLASRVDAVASRLETAIRMQNVSKAMGQTVKGMANAMKSMEPERIANTMSQFEKQFEDMDVRSGYMESTMESTTTMVTPPDQVESLMRMAADEAGLQVDSLMDDAGSTGAALPMKQVSSPDADLEARLAALKK
mmetsp:Transcript_25543/g.25782  ORF Transcript_25543/g.25782 Transcript_25543/m.25782 type:complete len:203 (-) Transcript_25543:75-683(-)